MIRPRAIIALLFLTCIACATFAADPSATTSPAQHSAESIFDRAADLLSKNPPAARSLFAAAADEYEHIAANTTAQQARGTAFYNAGTARQLAGDRGRAVLAFRRAHLLAPLTPGLAERLATARAESRGEPALAATSNAGEWLEHTARSFGRSLRWQIFITLYVLFWLLMLGRFLMHPLSRLRPHAATLWISGILCAMSVGALAILVRDDARAAKDAVVLTETIAFSEPDDLVGKPSGTPLKPGREIIILEERTGGNGQPWWRVRPMEEPAVTPGAATMWIPAAAAARVIDDQTAVIAAR